MSARPEPSIGAPPRTERGDETPRSKRKEEDTADEATEERAPPERLRGKGEGAPPPSSARPRRAARERGGTLERHSRGTPRKGGN